MGSSGLGLSRMPEQECCSSSKAKLGSPSRPAADGAMEALHSNKTSIAFSPCRHYGYTLESPWNSKQDHVLESDRFGMLVVYKLIPQPGHRTNL